MRRPVAAFFVGLGGAWILVAGCSASGSDAQINGPSYELDASGDDAGGGASAAGDGGTHVPGSDAALPTDSAPSDASVATDASPSDDAPAAPDGGSPDDAGGCASRTVVLGGNDFSIFGAVAQGSGAFATSTLTGSVGVTPALVAFGGGFQALLAETVDAGTGGALVGLAYAGGAWSAPSALGASAVTIDSPSAAVVGATVQAVYLTPAHDYFHATFSTAWDMGADPVRPPDDGGVTAFGPMRAAAAGTATQLVIVYEGSNQLPYAQTWTSGAGWDDGVALGSDLLAVNTPLAIAALGSGASDLLVVYAAAAGACSAGSGCLYAALRSAATKAWSAPALVSAAAYVNGSAPSAPSLAPTSSGGAIVAWEGANGEGYASAYAAAGWSTPAQLTAAQLTAAPSLASGVCGDDAVAAYMSLGSVYTTHLTGGAWTTPALLSGPAGVTSVAIATGP